MHAQKLILTNVNFPYLFRWKHCLHLCTRTSEHLNRVFLKKEIDNILSVSSVLTDLLSTSEFCSVESLVLCVDDCSSNWLGSIGSSLITVSTFMGSSLIFFSEGPPISSSSSLSASCEYFRFKNEHQSRKLIHILNTKFLIFGSNNTTVLICTFLSES